jgi:hypothetical protein
MGKRIREHAEPYADKAGVSRRMFFGTASGFAATMLAVNKITGMQFFEVTEAEAADQAAAKEIMISRKAGPDFIVDAHTHICTRKDGYIPGVNTTEKGMWFVQLLDNLGKSQGLSNGTKEMTVENFGKLILDGSDTSVAIFNPFGFREDYGGKDMIPIEEQVEVRNHWPDRSVMLRGGLTPNQGLSETLERLHMFVEVQDFRAEALHVRCDPGPRLVVRRREEGVSDLGRVPEARHQKHRLPQGHPIRAVHGPLCPSRGFRRGRRRLPGPEFHRLPLGVAIPERAGGSKDVQAAAY